MRNFDEQAFTGAEDQVPADPITKPMKPRQMAAPGSPSLNPQPVGPGLSAPQSVEKFAGAPAVDPMAFAPPSQATNAQGITTPPPAPAQDGASWFGGPQAVSQIAPPPQGGLPETGAPAGQPPAIGGASTRSPAPSVFNYVDPATGQGATAGSPTDVPGTVGYMSSPLVNGGTQTAAATPTNAFAGYVGPQGGGFGAPDSAYATPQGAANAWGGVTGIPLPAALQGKSGADVQAATKLMGGIANGDKASIQQALNSPIPEIQSAARRAQMTGAGFAYRNEPGLVSGGEWQNFQSQQAQQQQEAAKQDRLNRALSATFVPGQGSARVEGATGDIILGGRTLGNINDPNLDFSALQKAANAPGGYEMSGNGQAVPSLLNMVGGNQPSGTQTPGGAGMGLPPAQNGGAAPAPAGSTITSNAPTLSGMLSGGIPAGQTPTDANNPLTAQTLSVGPTADRFKLAQDQWANFDRATAPQYQASLRDALRAGAAAGGLGSGQLRTSLGDLANQRALALDTQRTGLLNEALGGSIEDAYRNVGIAQQQQGFQQGQQQQAFGNELASLGMGDQLKNSSFNRSLQQLMMGGQGNPADTQLALSGLFGQQAGQAGQTLADLIRGRTANNGAPSGAPSGGTDYNSLLQAILGGFKAQNVPAVQPGAAPTYRPTPGRPTVTSPGPRKASLPFSSGIPFGY